MIEAAKGCETYVFNIPVMVTAGVLALAAFALAVLPLRRATTKGDEDASG